ncbi:MAG: protein-S-isoprenylcysteine O-methyltransferase [Pseudomonadota bacterium]
MTEDVAAILWALGIGAWLVIRQPYRVKARKTKVVADRRSLLERATLGLCIVGLVVIPAVHVLTGLFSFADYPWTPTLGWLGTLVMIGFLVLFYLSHKHLARNWSVTLEIRKDHKLVDHGVYSHIRHPMYTSFWLWGLSQALLIPNWFAGLAGLASVALLYFSRVAKEEAMMRAQFGADYDDYCKRTGRLMPRLP